MAVRIGNKDYEESSPIFRNIPRIDTGFNLDVLQSAGIYFVQDPTNGPETGMWFILVFGSVDSSNRRRVGQYAFEAYGARTYQRTRQADGWTTWTRVGSGPDEGTNLSTLIDIDTGGLFVTSDTGTDALIPLVDETSPGLMSMADKEKLDTVEEGAQVNLSPEAFIELLYDSDGAGSGLDSDFLDGEHGAYYTNPPAASPAEITAGESTPADEARTFTIEQIIELINTHNSLSPTRGLIGMIVDNPTEVTPSFALRCDGTAYSRTTYAALFAKIGTRYGVGNGSTTFNVPDRRGEHIRGWANGSANDPDRASRTNRGDGVTGDNVGTKQGFAIHSHQHIMRFERASYTGATYSASGASFIDIGGTEAIDYTDVDGGTSTETRGRNVSTNFCIVFE